MLKMTQIQFQVISELHLETPEAQPLYEEFEIQSHCPYLALLGDIGNVRDSRLFGFLDRLLQNFKVVFYLLGNQEPHGTTFPKAETKLRTYQADVESQRRWPPHTKKGLFM